MEEYINERIAEIYDTSKISFVVKYVEPRIYEVDINIGKDKRTVRHSQDCYMTWEDNFDMIRYAIDKKIASIYKKED